MDDVTKQPLMKKYFTSFSYIYKGILGYIAYIVIAPPWLSAWIHKKRGVKIDNYKTVYIAPNVALDGNFPEHITIGNHVYITRGAKIVCHTAFTPLIHQLIGVEHVVQDVVIDDGAYIGVNAVIMPSVHVGKCAVIGSGAVVTKDVPDYAIVAGVPAQKIGDVRKLKKKMRLKF